MDRSLSAVLAGTFALRFSTGLTGAMLGLYLAKLSEQPGSEINPVVVGVFAASFFVTELALSPLFGILSDRIGHHRVMLYGPIFGGIAVVLTGLTSNLWVLGGSRLLQGSSTAASVPSILGYIALVTAGDEALRGKAAARFEGATLAGLGVGFIVAPKLFEALGASAFLLNTIVYVAAFLIYLLGVRSPTPEEERRGEARTEEHATTQSMAGARRYLRLLGSSHVLLLAPTWIAVNAAIGLWFSQSLFQFARANPQFPDQFLMRGFSANEITIAAIAVAILFGAGLLYWGNRFKALRRTTIILYGIAGGGAVVLGGLLVNHAGSVLVVALVAAALVGIGLFVLAGATPAALGLLADVTEAHPADRGAIMGLYSVFLGIGQIAGSILGGLAANVRGVDGMLVGTGVLLLIALVPLFRLRQQEHYFSGTAGPAAIEARLSDIDHASAERGS